MTSDLERLDGRPVLRGDMEARIRWRIAGEQALLERAGDRALLLVEARVLQRERRPVSQAAQERRVISTESSLGFERGQRERSEHAAAHAQRQGGEGKRHGSGAGALFARAVRARSEQQLRLSARDRLRHRGVHARPGAGMLSERPRAHALVAGCERDRRPVPVLRDLDARDVRDARDDHIHQPLRAAHEFLGLVERAARLRQEGPPSRRPRGLLVQVHANGGLRALARRCHHERAILLGELPRRREAERQQADRPPLDHERQDGQRTELRCGRDRHGHRPRPFRRIVEARFARQERGGRRCLRVCPTEQPGLEVRRIPPV
jgi:hypothetical protein